MAIDPEKLQYLKESGQISQETYNNLLSQVPRDPSLGSRTGLFGNEVGDLPPREEPKIEPSVPDVSKYFDAGGPKGQGIMKTMTPEQLEGAKETARQLPVLKSFVEPKVEPPVVEAKPEVQQWFKTSSSQKAHTPSMPKLQSPSLEGYETGVEIQQKAIDEQAQIQKDINSRLYEAKKEASDLAGQSADEMRFLQIGYQNKKDEENQKLNKMLDENVDPDRLWNNSSGLEKLGKLFAVFVGTLGATKAKMPNTALSIITDQMDKDIAAQKANIARRVGLQKNVIAQLRQDFQDELQVDAAAKAAYMDSVQQKMEGILSQGKSNVSQAQADQIIGEIEAEKEKYKAEFQSRAELNALKYFGSMAKQGAQASGVTGAIQEKIKDPVMKKAAMKEYDDNVAVDKSIKIIRESLTEMEKLGAIQSLLPVTEDYRKFESLYGRIDQTARQAMKGLGHLSDKDAEALERLLPKKFDQVNPLGSQRERVEGLIDFMETKRPEPKVLRDFGIDYRFGDTPSEGSSSAPKPSKSQSYRANGEVVGEGDLKDARSELLRNSKVTEEDKEKISSAIDKVAAEKKLPPALLYAVGATESAFNKDALSPYGAKGIWQFIPSTGRSYGLVKGNVDNRSDIDLSTEAVGNLWKDLLTTFDGDIGLAVRAYHSGPELVNVLVSKGKRSLEPGDEEDPQIAPLLKQKDKLAQINENNAHWKKILLRMGVKDGEVWRQDG